MKTLFIFLFPLFSLPSWALISSEITQEPKLSSLGYEAIRQLEEITGQQLTINDIKTLAELENFAKKSSQTATLEPSQMVTHHFFCFTVQFSVGGGFEGHLCSGQGLSVYSMYLWLAPDVGISTSFSIVRVQIPPGVELLNLPFDLKYGGAAAYYASGTYLYFEGAPINGLIPTAQVFSAGGGLRAGLPLIGGLTFSSRN